LINGADADLMLPEPVINCGSDDGYVMVIHKLLSPAKRPETGGGCASDRWSRRDVLAEAHKWVTLAPGAVFDMPIELMFANPD
jgi:hypothetical protein